MLRKLVAPESESLAIFHIQHNAIGRTTHAAGAAGAHAAYILRDSAAVSIVGNLPDLGADAAQAWFDGEELGDRKNARVCDTFNAAIPRELSPAQAVALLEDFAATATRDGEVWFVAAIHNDHDDNPHLHMMIRDRERAPVGKKAQRVLMTTSAGSTERFRETWELSANRALERAGIDERIDRRSYAERGIDLAPTPHLGPKPTAAKIAYHDEVVAANNELLAARRELQEAYEIVARVQQAIIAEQLLAAAEATKRTEIAERARKAAESVKKTVIPKLLERLHARDDVGKVTNVDAPSFGMQISGKLLDVDDDAIAIANGRDDRAAVVRMPVTQQIRELVGRVVKAAYDRVGGWIVTDLTRTAQDQEVEQTR